MKQADLGLNLTTKRTRKRKFLGEMERVVPQAKFSHHGESLLLAAIRYFRKKALQR